MKEKINSELATTDFVNIDDKPFSIYINNSLVREIEPGETHPLVVYVAQVGAKHLVDRILQEKHGIKDSLRDTPLRQSLFAKILPQMAEERAIKPLDAESERAEIRKQLDGQAKQLAEFQETLKKESSQEKEIAELKEKLAKLELRLSPEISEKPVKGTKKK